MSMYFSLLYWHVSHSWLDREHHINKHVYKVPFVCGARNLGEALRRISEGAAFIRTKGEAGTGNIVEACVLGYDPFFRCIGAHQIITQRTALEGSPERNPQG